MNPLPQFLRVPSALILALALSSAAFAEIYKWTDAQGNTHYTQTPPQGQESQAKDVENIANDIGMAAGTLTNESEATDTAKSANKNDDEMAAAKTAGKENTIKHQSFCRQQKSALKQLLANPVIRWKSDDEERILTADERQEKITKFSGNINEMCNDRVLSTDNGVGAN